MDVSEVQSRSQEDQELFCFFWHIPSHGSSRMGRSSWLRWVIYDFGLQVQTTWWRPWSTPRYITPNKNQPGKQFLSDTDLGISKCIEDCIVSKPSLFWRPAKSCQAATQFRAAGMLQECAGCLKNRRHARLHASNIEHRATSTPWSFATCHCHGMPWGRCLGQVRPDEGPVETNMKQLFSRKSSTCSTKRGYCCAA
jgi:hypothetical protein